MKLNGKNAGKGAKVDVGREDGHVITFRNRAQQEVSIRALDAFRPACVEVLGSAFVVLRSHGQIRKVPQALPQAIEIGAMTDAGQ